MADLISVPLKKPSDVDIEKPLRNLIQATYNTSGKQEDYNEAISELSKLRHNAVWKVFDKYESSLEVIYSYYDQLCALEAKIPPQELQIPFKWKDAFDKGSLFGGRMSLTVSSLSYERVCVLFNIASLQSAVGASQSPDSDDGLKLAAKLFQQAAGIFNYLRANVMMAVHQETTPDLNPETLGAISQLMLAQAQEMFVLKSIKDGMKDVIIAKLASQCEDLYAEALRVFQKENLRPLWEKEWLPIVAGKQAAYNGMSQYYQSLVCKDSKAVGEEICRLQQAVELFRASQARSGKPNYFQEHLNKAQRNLTEALKDNDFIYHERIPDARQLDSIGKAPLAKATPMPDKHSINFKDLFESLVPVAVHHAIAASQVRRGEAVDVQINKLRESTQLLNSILASLNLPACVENIGNDGEGGLPPSILEKAASMRQAGGVEALRELIIQMPELLQRNNEILHEAERLLREEKESDDQLRQQFGERWNRTPSEKLTQTFVANAAKYREIIDKAIAADQIVQQKFEQHREGMELLSKSDDELQASVPQGPAGGLRETSAVAKLRSLMEEVETVKAERDVMESELKNATLDLRAEFLTALQQSGAIDEPSVTAGALGSALAPLSRQVDDSLQRQAGLVSEIQAAHSSFVSEQGNRDGSGNDRSAMMVRLAAANDSFHELKDNIHEGKKFYNDLTQILLPFQNKISDYCFARKAEKEELLKDLTQQASRGSQPPAPTPPQPIRPTERKEAPPRPPPPGASSSQQPQQQQQQQPNLPYPNNPQGGMPVPYAAGSAAPYPYPAYQPPPMPQGYNPYGTMPYPQNPQYPGFPQGPVYQGYQYPPNPQQPYPQQQYNPYQPQQPPRGW